MADNVNRQGYQLTDEELKKVQMIEMEMIDEIDRICRKCGIHYNMVGGTMLGAIRHKGHIPWDDDADIGFLRNEYEKFRKACQTELNTDKFYFQDFRDTKGYRWGYGKLRRKGTEFVRLQQEKMPYEQGIFIDIMPFDNIPDNIIHRKIHKCICFCYRKIFWSAIGRKTDTSAVKRMLYQVLYCIPENMVKKSFEKFILSGQRKKTKQVRILTFPTPKRTDGYERRWYTELDKYEFSGRMLPGAKDYDGYLKVKYGDYMKLPPIEKRIVHPISFLKLLEEQL